MRRAALADTGQLYAAVDRDDAYHGQAQAVVATARRQEDGR
jgi:hypothetical protein